MRKMNFLNEEKSEEGLIHYHINQRKPFNELFTLDDKDIENAKKFAYEMTFEKKGEHRNLRTGSETEREVYEVFLNTLNGKLGEIALRGYMLNRGIKFPKVDFDTYGLGEWDNADFVYGNLKVSIKTIKHFSNLLLLEEGDWTEDGLYVPNIPKDGGKYDFHILVRLQENNKILSSFEEKGENYNFTKEEVDAILKNYKVKIDVPGFASQKMLVDAINHKHVIFKKNYIGKHTPIQANNYYIQTGALYNIDMLVDYLATLEN